MEKKGKKKVKDNLPFKLKIKITQTVTDSASYHYICLSLFLFSFAVVVVSISSQSKMAARNLLLLSNSTVHGSGYLDWAAEYVKEFLKSKSVQSVVFVPYALRDMDSYAEKAIKKFSAWGFEMSSVHRAADPIAAVRGAEAIFVGGGNTFQLLKNLYDNKLIEPIRKKVLEEGAPYIGSSAGDQRRHSQHLHH
ncbi:hypothetical protein O3P69_019508 [Scylla paramamosain]|uniref:Dipeptidase E n=1 Tax=Scylla paramamosain TaxID=85552 RepID=A0AAW0SXT4_SCYPA